MDASIFFLTVTLGLKLLHERARHARPPRAGTQKRAADARGLQRRQYFAQDAPATRHISDADVARCLAALQLLSGSEAAAPRLPSLEKGCDDVRCDLVDTPAALEALAPILHAASVVAVDVEHSPRSFHGFVCTIQLSLLLPDGSQRDVVLDCLPAGMREAVGEHLGPVFGDAAKVVIMHGCANDVRWLASNFGVTFAAPPATGSVAGSAAASEPAAAGAMLLDTAVLARMATHGPLASATSGNSTALAALLLSRFGIVSDKSLQRADWRVRPLPPAWLEYARTDTRWLIPLARWLLVEQAAAAAASSASLAAVSSSSAAAATCVASCVAGTVRAALERCEPITRLRYDVEAAEVFQSDAARARASRGVAEHFAAYSDDAGAGGSAAALDVPAPAAPAAVMLLSAAASTDLTLASSVHAVAVDVAVSLMWARHVIALHNDERLDDVSADSSICSVATAFARALATSAAPAAAAPLAAPHIPNLLQPLTGSHRTAAALASSGGAASSGSFVVEHADDAARLHHHHHHHRHPHPLTHHHHVHDDPAVSALLPPDISRMLSPGGHLGHVSVYASPAFLVAAKRVMAAYARPDAFPDAFTMHAPTLQLAAAGAASAFAAAAPAGGATAATAASLASASQSQAAAREALKSTRAARLFQPRATPLYNNIELLAPNGVVIARIDKRKAQWYQDVGAVDVLDPVTGDVVDSGKGAGSASGGDGSGTGSGVDVVAVAAAAANGAVPLRLRLKQEPRGLGHAGDPFHLSQKLNLCVCCGISWEAAAASGGLNRCYIIPHFVRMHFPLASKSYTSHDVVLTCTACHRKADVASQQMVARLCRELGVPTSSREAERMGLVGCETAGTAAGGGCDGSAGDAAGSAAAHTDTASSVSGGAADDASTITVDPAVRLHDDPDDAAAAASVAAAIARGWTDRTPADDQPSPLLVKRAAATLAKVWDKIPAERRRELWGKVVGADGRIFALASALDGGRAAATTLSVDVPDRTFVALVAAASVERVAAALQHAQSLAASGDGGADAADGASPSSALRQHQQLIYSPAYHIVKRVLWGGSQWQAAERFFPPSALGKPCPHCSSGTAAGADDVLLDAGAAAVPARRARCECGAQLYYRRSSDETASGGAAGTADGADAAGSTVAVGISSLPLAAEDRLARLVRRWRAHFVATVQPRYLPENWSVDYRVFQSGIRREDKDEPALVKEAWRHFGCTPPEVVALAQERAAAEATAAAAAK